LNLPRLFGNLLLKDIDGLDDEDDTDDDDDDDPFEEDPFDC